MCKSAACAKLKCANAFRFQKRSKGCTQTLHYVKLSYEAKQDCANVFCSICTTMRCAKRNAHAKNIYKYCMEKVNAHVHFAFVALVRQYRT